MLRVSGDCLLASSPAANVLHALSFVSNCAAAAVQLKDW